MIKKQGLGLLGYRLIAIVIGISVFAYFIYHVSSLFNEDIATISTGITTESTYVDGKGYIFRDESVLYSENTGVADYYKTDGSKVSIGDKLASISEVGDAVAKSTVRILDKRISVLEKSVENTLEDESQIKENIFDTYYALSKTLATGDTGDLAKQTEKLLVEMNKYSIASDDESPVKNTLKELVEQRDNLVNGAGKGVTEISQDSGYFYSYVDGYEKEFTTEIADNITAEDFYDITQNAKPDSKAMEMSYGKLSENSEWRFVMHMSEEASAYFYDKTGEIFNLKFAENGNTIIPMTLQSQVTDTVGGGKILVFWANRLPQGFVFNRCQSVSIPVFEASGIYVPKSATHRMGETLGVYVLRGSVVVARRIEVEYEGQDFYLVKVIVDDDITPQYLGANELLIIKGGNLFDGRILD